MPQIFEIYINGNCLRFAKAEDTGSQKSSQNADADIPAIIKKLETTENLEDTNIITSNPGAAFREFCKLFSIVTSAGGIVQDIQKNVLIMYRRGSWDLPKGKIEAGEDLAEAAIREVREETGLQNISVQEFAGTTYHAWRMQGKLYLKPTLWFKMRGISTDKITPQTEEDIEQVKWVPLEELPNYYPQMHNNLVPLLKKVLA